VDGGDDQLPSLAQQEVPAKPLDSIVPVGRVQRAELAEDGDHVAEVIPGMVEFLVESRQQRRQRPGPLRPDLFEMLPPVSLLGGQLQPGQEVADL
jgi:hypothetical protein